MEPRCYGAAASSPTLCPQRFQSQASRVARENIFRLSRVHVRPFDFFRTLSRTQGRYLVAHAESTARDNVIRAAYRVLRISLGRRRTIRYELSACSGLANCQTAKLQPPSQQPLAQTALQRLVQKSTDSSCQQRVPPPGHHLRS